MAGRFGRQAALEKAHKATPLIAPAFALIRPCSCGAGGAAPYQSRLLDCAALPAGYRNAMVTAAFALPRRVPQSGGTGEFAYKKVEILPMKPFVKNSLAFALAGAMTVAAISPTLARTWRNGAAVAGAGFVAGTAVGAAAANAAYGPAYQAYAYSPGQAYGGYGYGSGADGLSGCATAGNYGGKIDYGAC